MNESQVTRRRPVWIALSALWLDTEIEPGELENIARVMIDSGLTNEELREAYLIEVAPVVYRNLLSVAGEWQGFDEEWLCAEIARNLRERPRRTRWLGWFFLTRRTMTYATEDHWESLMDIVRRHRA